MDYCNCRLPWNCFKFVIFRTCPSMHYYLTIRTKCIWKLQNSFMICCNENFDAFSNKCFTRLSLCRCLSTKATYVTSQSKQTISCCAVAVNLWAQNYTLFVLLMWFSITKLKWEHERIMWGEFTIVYMLCFFCCNQNQL